MTTALHSGIREIDSSHLPAFTVPTRPNGILARVRRTCAEHHCECRCVGHLENEGCLVFWCEHGDHSLTFR